MLAHAIMSQPPPARPIAGDKSTGKPSNVTLEPFSDAVVASLIHADKGIASQDGQELRDEKAILTYMASDKSNAMAPPLDNELNYPLSCYYINSSHNTYLSGHQLYGDASAEAYTTVLKRGCRCLEIDVWDGDDSDTSNSSEDDEKSESRWGKVKARAARIRSRSRSSSSATPPVAIQTSKPAAGQRDENKDMLASSIGTDRFSYDASHLSPHPSPSLPPRPEPRVLHGYTLTQSITFRSVCHAIRESAFVSTDLPLIVSLEVHASLEQQLVMVDIIREVWSGYLVSLEKGTEVSTLPAPEALRSKILIKVKWTPNTETGEVNDPLEHVSSNSTGQSSEGQTGTSPEKQKKASKILAALSELGIYTKAYSFKHFSQPEASIPTHVFSLSENKIRDMHHDPYHGPALFKHNKSYLMRVFPKGTRINSSNVDPTLHWRAGAQMVALNWQKTDKGMMLNEGMFAGTGGWTLKPSGYRCKLPTESSLPPQHGEEPLREQLDLDIRLLAAQRIPIPSDKESSHASKIKPYIKAQLHPDSVHSLSLSKTTSGSNTTNEARVEDDDKNSIIYKRKSATYRTDGPDFGGELLSWANVPDVVQALSFMRCRQCPGCSKPYIFHI